MNLNDVKPLQPLSYGKVLIVGVKSSNFDDELRTHPRVILWDSQNEHWTDKGLPGNVQAVFFTRFIGHAAFKNILIEARKKNISIFNPEGTGMIARQVKELLAIHKTEEQIMVQETEEKPKSKYQPNKLGPLHSHIDFSKNNMENARHLLRIAAETGIQTTLGSLAQMVVVERRKMRGPVTKTIITRKPVVDVSVEILDNMIKELTDMREFLLATVEENKQLKERVETLKKVLG